jgi:hypothetical protein
MTNCQICKASATIEVSFNNIDHGRDEIQKYCVTHFVETNEANQFPSGVGIEMTSSARKELNGYFG